MRKSPALGVSFQFLETTTTKLVTKLVSNILYLQKAENPYYSPKAGHKQFHQVIMAILEAGWCPKGHRSPKEKGVGGGMGYFQHHFEHTGK